MLIEPFLQFFFIFSAQFLNAISSEVPGPIDFKFYMRPPGEGLYQRYGNYANAAILSAERQGPCASCCQMCTLKVICHFSIYRPSSINI